MKSKSVGRPRSELARAAILQSAYALLEEGGVTKVTIEAVASHAKVGKPTIYRYWSNAQELAMAAVMERPDQKQPDLEGMPPLAALREQLGSVVARFTTPAGRQAAILMASSHTDSELSKAFRNQIILKSREDGRKLLMDVLEHHSPKQAQAIDTILDMIYGPIFYRLLVGHAPLDIGFADEIIETINPLLIDS